MSWLDALETDDVTTLPASDVDPSSIDDYDLMLMGSGAYMAEVGDSIQNIIKMASSLPAWMAFFTTHSNPDPNMWQNAFKKIQKQVEKKGTSVVGQFECRGENKLTPVEMLLKLYQGDQEKVDAYLECARGHPDEEDEENAPNFCPIISI